MVIAAAILPHKLSLSPFSFLPHSPLASPNPTPNPNVVHPSPPPPRRRLRLPCAGESGPFRFEDDGETFFGKKEKRKWWSDESTDGFDEDFDAFDDEDDEPVQFWDRFWIFKVFKSYGYFLPVIIASMLLATGPKAFLMALALPLGQSAISLAFEKLWGGEREISRSRSRSRKGPFRRYARDFDTQDDDDIPEPNQTKQGFRSQVASNGGATNKRGKHTGKFGGWDELDGREYQRTNAWAQQPRATSSSASNSQAIKRGKMPRVGRNREAPLFIRLLIAVFPFLGSWTKLL